MTTRFDESVEAAWARFEEKLVRDLAVLEVDAHWSVTVDRADGVCPWEGVIFSLASTDDGVRGWLIGAPGGAEAALDALGWSLVDDEWWCEGAPVAQLASLVATTMRAVYGVASPAFLRDPENDRDDDAEEVEEPTFAMPAITHPDGSEELQELVDATLSAHWQHEVEHDGDGDVPITNGVVPVWVSVDGAEARVRVFSHVVLLPRRRQQTQVELDVLNRRHADICFLLEGDTVIAETYVDGMPFVPSHLVRAVGHLLTTVDDVAADTAVRLGGHLFFDGSDR